MMHPNTKPKMMGGLPERDQNIILKAIAGHTVRYETADKKESVTECYGKELAKYHIDLSQTATQTQGIVVIFV